MPLEYIISGHSGKTEEIFTIPYNVSVIFYANEGETCFVPNNEESLKIVVGSMQTSQTYNSGQTIKNYNVDFTDSGFEGIAKVNRYGENISNFEFFSIPISITKLSEYINYIQRKKW
jgi:hypothetical protein